MSIKIIKKAQPVAIAPRKEKLTIIKKSEKKAKANVIKYHNPDWKPNVTVFKKTKKEKAMLKNLKHEVNKQLHEQYGTKRVSQKQYLPLQNI